MERLERALYQAAVRTFEELAFTFVAPETAQGDGGEATATASVAFVGPMRGELRLSLPVSTLRPLAAAMLGSEPGPHDGLDALGEVTNVICGNILPSLAGPRAAFRMSAPRIVTDPAREPLAASVVVPLADGRASLALYADSGPAP